MPRGDRRIVSSALRARVRGAIGEDALHAAVGASDAGRSVSALIRGSATVSVEAEPQGVV